MATKGPYSAFVGTRSVISYPTISNSSQSTQKDGNKVISGGADNAARMFDITNGQTTQVAQHDAPIKVVKWIETPQGSILATGSWDKTLKVCAHPPSIANSALIPFTFASIGTSVPQVLLPQFNYRNVATPWMCNILSWSLALRNVIFKYSI